MGSRGFGAVSPIRPAKEATVGPAALVYRCRPDRPTQGFGQSLFLRSSNLRPDFASNCYLANTYRSGPISLRP